MIKHIDIDPINKTLHIRFEDGDSARTIDFKNRTDVLIDLSKSGKMIGVEILNIDIPRKVLIDIANKYKMPSLKKVHPNQYSRLIAA